MRGLDKCDVLWYNNIVVMKDACVAQLVVQLIRNEQVAGSNPVTSSHTKNRLTVMSGGFAVCVKRDVLSIRSLVKQSDGKSY